MSSELEDTIENFLEEMLYINPQTARTVQNIFNMKKRQAGMIQERKNTHEKLSSQ